jgi:hypothetical protein
MYALNLKVLTGWWGRHVHGTVGRLGTHVVQARSCNELLERDLHDRTTVTTLLSNYCSSNCTELPLYPIVDNVFCSQGCLISILTLMGKL